MSPKSGRPPATRHRHESRDQTWRESLGSRRVGRLGQRVVRTEGAAERCRDILGQECAKQASDHTRRQLAHQALGDVAAHQQRAQSRCETAHSGAVQFRQVLAEQGECASRLGPSQHTGLQERNQVGDLVVSRFVLCGSPVRRRR